MKKGAVFNGMDVGPMVRWIKGKLCAKNQGNDSREQKGLCLLSNFRDRQTRRFGL